MEPHIDSDGKFVYDTIKDGVWYVMRPKQGCGARAIPNAQKVIEGFNEELRKELNEPDGEYMTTYAPRYSYQVSLGVFRQRYLLPDIIFVHAKADIMQKFMHDRPYQLFFVNDRSRKSETNTDEYGNLVHDIHMRMSTSAIADFYKAVKSYSEDMRVFTAQELHELKYTRQVIITDGPFEGRTCRIKSIEGKSRIIVELLEGSFALVLLMPDTHFQRV